MSYLDYIKKKEYQAPTISFEEVEEECDILAGSPDTGDGSHQTSPETNEDDKTPERGGRSSAKSSLFGTWSDDSYFEDEWE